ncbi:branched-chain amino acid transport system II carrier protein [Fluviispira vulneris]|uniref:branched-chain amino acid transport system II carrier protein n=1 Tax=Fluviispira vulneris TaxID=2763012 RepID=UPI0016451FEC|nr:branched-chain amino acid transport system II carrier protein [Fluviispira vulneris]
MSAQVRSVAKIKIFIAGFAAFAMFFGSGNLVFPLLLGSKSPTNWFYSSLGLAITGVLVPFLGLVAMTCLKGSQDAFFRWLGKVAGWIIPFLILLLIGPFGVIPRCIAVGYGAWQSFSEQTPLWLFALGCVAVIWLATFSNRKLVDVVGKYFTPFKLGALAIVIGGSFYFAITSQQGIVSSSAAVSPATSFKESFFEGYHTMDLMAALFFGVSLVHYFKAKENDIIPFKPTLIAMAIGMFLLFVVYMALVYLGAAYSSQISHLPATQMLPEIASIALGETSDYLISFTLVVSCLTTAVALTAVSVDFICEKVAFLREKRQLTLVLCLIVTFIIAMTGFTGIMSLMAPILSWLYPFVIGLTILNIAVHFYKIRKSSKLDHRSKKAA